MKCLRLFIIFSLFTCAVYSQKNIFKPDVVKKALYALEINEDLKIDGILNEEIWRKVKPSPQFTQINPFQGEKPTQETIIKVVYNKQYLYFGVFCKDSLGKSAIRVTDFKRDFNYKTNDLITLNIDAFRDERNAMSFAVNPYGVQRDYLSFDATYYDIEWDAYWKTRTTRTDEGWIAEIAIPWKTLRYPKSSETKQDWIFQIYRNRRLTNEISAFSPFPQSFSSARMDYAGEIKNLKPPAPKGNIKIQPYTLVSHSTYNGSDASRKKEETKFKPGGEVKLALSSSNILDLTFNTDFAQAEVDEQINNTTRFSVFFPEKRQFFLENASLFGINAKSKSGGDGIIHIQPFFSRRIGLDDEGKPIPIEVGARFVHRSSNTNYGAMYINQKGNSLTSSTNFFVGRFSENIGNQNRVGALLTFKDQNGSNNLTGTIDGFFRMGKSHSLTTLASFTNSSNINKTGFAGSAQYYYSTNKWKAFWSQSIVTQDYNPEMGFISRSDVLGTTPGAIRYFRGEKLPFKKWLRAFEPSVAAKFYHSVSKGELIERQLVSYPFYLNLQNGGYFGYGFNNIYQKLTNSFSPLGVFINSGKYNYTQHTVLASSDPSRKLNFNGIITWGDYFNGKLTSTNLKVHYGPIPHILFGVRFNRNSFSKVGEFKNTKDVDLYSFETRLALNPRVQLTGVYQKNSENKLRNTNFRFSWEYAPLSFVHLVYNHTGFEDALFVQQNEDQAIFKLSLLKQF